MGHPSKNTPVERREKEFLTTRRKKGFLICNICKKNMRSVQIGKKLSEGMILYFILILLQSIVYYKYYGALKKTGVVKMKVFFWFS